MFLKSFCRFVFVFFVFVFAVSAQNLSYERARHKGMLELVKNDVKKNYYDTNFRGIDLEAKYKAAVEKLEQAASVGQMSGVIAQFLLDFDDSHLFFIPPGKVNKTDYGFDMKIIGDKCFVYRVREKSDAANKGLQVGDEIFSLDGYAPTREIFWKMEYFYFTLRPRPVLKLAIIKPDGKEVNLEITAKITQGKQVMDLTGQDINQIIREDDDAYRKSIKQYFHDKIDGLFIWKMPAFSIEPSKVDDIIDRAKKSQALILDLRGNGGGRVDTVLRLIGNFFPENIKVADEKRRKETKAINAKSRGKDIFTGKLTVLIDSQSASASEVFSRVVQLEKRGTVIGDRSAGAVMESKFFSNQLGMDVVIYFGASITIADLIMTDGKSLEKTGVLPDEKLIPTAKDLASNRDVILSKAIENFGFKMSPEEAGKIFSVEYE